MVASSSLTSRTSTVVESGTVMNAYARTFTDRGRQEPDHNTFFLFSGVMSNASGAQMTCIALFLHLNPGSHRTSAAQIAYKTMFPSGLDGSYTLISVLCPSCLASERYYDITDSNAYAYDG